MEIEREASLLSDGKARDKIEPHLRNLRWMLNRVRKAHDGASLAKAALTADLEGASVGVAKFAEEARRCLGVIRSMEQGDGLPPTFRAALAFAVMRSGKGIATFEKQTSAYEGHFSKWMNGHTPTGASAHIVALLEVALNLPPKIADVAPGASHLQVSSSTRAV